MKKFIDPAKSIMSGSSKASVTVYVILRALVILCLVRELINGNYSNAFLCVLSLILFLVPAIIEKTFKINFPTVLEIIVFLFIFAAEILGEINNFYGKIAGFDTLLHTLNGFLAASIGFSLVYLLNENSNSIKLTPFFVALVAFCFSMTIGVVWEFFEFGMDSVFKTDMQKDQYISSIHTVTLDPEFKNNVVKIDGIDKTVLYDENGEELAEFSGYLDIGINDTMEDMFVNFIGALVYSVFGYLYCLNSEKYKMAGRFLTTKKL